MESQTLSTPDGQRRFLELHKLYRGTMLNVAFRILRDHHLAEDAVQEAFMRIARNFHKICEIDSPPTRSFVVIIVRNVSLNMLVRLNRRVPEVHIDSEPVTYTNMEDSILERADYETVLAIIQSLPSIYRESLLLYYVNELNTIEIAQRLGIGKEAAKKRIQRGRQMVIDGLPEDE